MACIQHYCLACKKQEFDNNLWKACLYCKNPNVSNWFDEEQESDCGDDYEAVDMED